MKIDHIGYAVKDIEKAKITLKAFGFLFGETVDDQVRNVRICFGETGEGYRIELVAPMGGGSPVDAHISKIGPTPYHICYRSRNIETDVEELRKNHFKVSIPPAPAVAFNGKRVVFLYSLTVGLIEIVEE